MGLRALAFAIGMPQVTLYNWVGRGWVRARREDAPPHRWILWADATELLRLRQHHQRSLSEEGRRRWRERTPTNRPAVAQVEGVAIPS